MDVEAGSMWAAAGAAATAVAGSVVKLIGSKKDRDSDRSKATEEWRDLAHEARKEHAECKRQTAVLSGRLEELRVTVMELTIEHGQCPTRIETLERQVKELQRKSEPPEDHHANE